MTPGEIQDDSTTDPFVSRFSTRPLSQCARFRAHMGTLGTHAAVIRSAPAGRYIHPPYDGVSIYMANSRLQGRIDLGEGPMDMLPQRGDFCVTVAGASGVMESERGGHGVQVIIPPAALDMVSTGSDRGSMDFGLLHKGFKRHAPVADILRRFTQFVETDADVDPLFADSLILELVEVLHTFADTTRRRLREATKLETQCLDQIIDMMDARLGERIVVDDFAAIAGMTRSGFLKAFRNTVGETPYQHILRRRLERARRQLMSSDTSIAEIAYNCGFSSQQHLTHLFKEKMGISPARFRHQTVTHQRRLIAHSSERSLT